MNDGKFHLPARKKTYSSKTQVVRISIEAYNAANEMFFDSGIPISQIISNAILFANQNAVYDEED